MIPPGKVAAIVPAFCEERFIGDVVRRAISQVATVLVVDDGSADGTTQQAREAGAEVLRHPRNLGKGAAIKSGLSALAGRGFSHAVLLDADGQHRPEEIPLFLAAACPVEPCIIVGNRMSDPRGMPLVRCLVNRFMSERISRLCHRRIPDSQCGFRLVPMQLAPALNCESDAYDFETEMLLIAAGLGIRIDSVPVSTVYGEEKSKIRPLRDAARFFRLLKRYSEKAAARSA